MEASAVPSESIVTEYCNVPATDRYMQSRNEEATDSTVQIAPKQNDAAPMSRQCTCILLKAKQEARQPIPAPEHNIEMGRMRGRALAGFPNPSQGELE